MIKKHLFVQTAYISHNGDLTSIAGAIHTIVLKITQDHLDTMQSHTSATKPEVEELYICIHLAGTYSTRFYRDNIKNIIFYQNSWSDEDPETTAEKKSANAMKVAEFNRLEHTLQTKDAIDGKTAVINYITEKVSEGLHQLDVAIGNGAQGSNLNVVYSFQIGNYRFKHYLSDYISNMKEVYAETVGQYELETMSPNNYILFTNSNAILKLLPSTRSALTNAKLEKAEELSSTKLSVNEVIAIRRKKQSQLMSMQLLELITKTLAAVYLNIESGSDNVHLDLLYQHLKLVQTNRKITVIDPATLSDEKSIAIKQCCGENERIVSATRAYIKFQIKQSDPTKDMIIALKKSGFATIGNYSDLNPTGIQFSNVVFQSLINASESFVKSVPGKKAVVVVFGGEKHARALSPGAEFIQCIGLARVSDLCLHAIIACYIAQTGVNIDEILVWNPTSNKDVWCVSVFAKNIPAAASALDLGAFSGGNACVEASIASEKVFGIAPSHNRGRCYHSDMTATKTDSSASELQRELSGCTIPHDQKKEQDPQFLGTLHKSLTIKFLKILSPKAKACIANPLLQAAEIARAIRPASAPPPSERRLRTGLQAAQKGAPISARPTSTPTITAVKGKQACRHIEESGAAYPPKPNYASVTASQTELRRPASAPPPNYARVTAVAPIPEKTSAVAIILPKVALMREKAYVPKPNYASVTASQTELRRAASAPTPNYARVTAVAPIPEKPSAVAIILPEVALMREKAYVHPAENSHLVSRRAASAEGASAFYAPYQENSSK
jgi:hypothetical protein